MALTATTARIEITPTVAGSGYANMAGYASTSTPRLAIATYDRLWCKCLILYGSGTPKAIIALDLPHAARAWVAALNTRLLALSSWGLADILMVSSHTHSGPATNSPVPYADAGITDTTAIDEYEAWLADRIVACVTDALAQTPVGVSLDYKHISQTWAHSTSGGGTAETQVPILVARKPDGQPLAVVYGYGCHPVSMGPIAMWDGDYVSAASGVIEGAIPGTTALFLPGAMGDQEPPSTGRGQWLRTTLGTQLGAAVVAATATAGRVVGATITTARTEVNIPLDVTAGPAAMRAAYVARQSHAYAWFRRHGETKVAEIDMGANVPGGYATSWPTAFWGWKLSGSPLLRLAVTAHELNNGYADWARGRWGGTNGVVVGSNCGDITTYLCRAMHLPPVKIGGSYTGQWDTDFPYIAGEAATVYGPIGHFRPGNTAGISIQRIIEDTLASLLD